MKLSRFFLWVILIGGLLSGCAEAPPVVVPGALPQMPFPDLIAHVDQYKGKAVVLSGYVLTVENQKDYSRIIAIEAPSDSEQRPKSKDFSQGRLVLIYNGFIDPEVYTKDRRITVGGIISGGAASDPEVPYPYLQIQVQDLYLWPVESPGIRAPYWYGPWYGPWYSPWYSPWYGYGPWYDPWYDPWYGWYGGYPYRNYYYPGHSHGKHVHKK